jgi:hypothetical protein
MMMMYSQSMLFDLCFIVTARLALPTLGTLMQVVSTFIVAIPEEGREERRMTDILFFNAQAIRVVLAFHGQ